MELVLHPPDALQHLDHFAAAVGEEEALLPHPALSVLRVRHPAVVALLLGHPAEGVLDRARVVEDLAQPTLEVREVELLELGVIIQNPCGVRVGGGHDVVSSLMMILYTTTHMGCKQKSGLKHKIIWCPGAQVLRPLGT